jgi:hypothetical protein
MSKMDNPGVGLGAARDELALTRDRERGYIRLRIDRGSSGPSRHHARPRWALMRDPRQQSRNLRSLERSRSAAHG